MINGFCESKYQIVKNIFQESISQGVEKGGSFCIYNNGKKLIHLWGGKKDNIHDWNSNTLVNVFSVTKGIYEILVSKLIELNEIDLKKPVYYYWKNFKDSSKRSITIENILSHESGLFRFKQKLKIEDLIDWEKIIKILEDQIPEHEPGTRTFYHSQTHGYLIGEIIKKILGQSIGKTLNDLIIKKFNLNFFIGTPKNKIKNIACLDLKKLDSLSFNNNNDIEELKQNIKFYNQQKWQAAEVPSINGHGDSESIAKIYDLVANDLKLEKNNIVKKKTIKICLEEKKKRIDEFLNASIRWTNIGLILRGGWIFGKNKESFGHNGWGGSVGFADPINGLGFSYITNHLNPSMAANSTAIRLIKSFYELFK